MRKSAIFKALVIAASLIIPVERVEAQVSYDQVTATVTDPDGHLLANAPFSWVLVDSLGNRVSSATTPNGQIYNAAPVRGNLSNAGVMSVQLVPNGILTKPSGTRWQLSITPPLPVDQSNILTYQPPWNLTYTTTISAPVDLSTQISAQTSIVNYFNTQTGQSTLTGWLVGTSDPPSLPCSAGLHAGYLYMASDNAAFQCNNAVGGVYQWNLFVGSSTAGVSKIIPGTNVTCSPNVSGSCQGNVTLNATASSTTVNVNGSPVSNPNFNGSTPAAGSNGKNIAFQVSSSNVSGEVVGDGNAAHYLDGTGSYSTPAGTGTLTSINSQTGPAITLQSTGGTVTITAPTSNHINLEAAASASGVQYNGTDTLYLWIGPDSTIGDDSHINGTLISAGAWSCTAGGTQVCTINTTGAHGLVVGDWITTEAILTGWPGVPSPFAAWTSGYDLFQVASVPTSTSITINAAWASLSGASGSGGQIENANFFLPFYTARLPFFNGHGSTQTVLPIGSTIVSLAANYATTVHPAITAWLALHPTATIYAIITGGRNDIQACTAEGTLKTDLLTVAASIHTDGGKVIFNTITPNPFNTSNLGCHTAFVTMNDLNNWAKNKIQVFDSTTGQYFDRVIDPYATINDLNSSYFFLTSGSGALTNNGLEVYAHIQNDAMSNQLSSYRGFPDNIVPGPQGGSLVPGFGFTHLATSTGKFAESWWNTAGTTTLFGIDGSSGPYLPLLVSQPCIGTSSQGYFQAGTGCGTTTNALTFNNGGSGDASGSTFNGSAAKTLSYNSIGAAPLASPTFTGTPAAPTAAPGTNTTQIASTAFVQAAVTAAGGAFGGGLGTSFQDVTEIAAPANPAAGNDRLYTNSTTHKLACLTSGGADCMPTGSTGISGATSGQALIAGSATTATSSVALAGAGAGLTTGPVSGTTANDFATFNGTDGRIKDSGVLITAIPAANIASGALVNGMTATTQSAADNSTKLATTAYVDGRSRAWSCQPGLGDGLNAITAGTYLQSTCKNTTGVTITLTGLQCFTDNSGSSTMNAAGNTLGALLTGAVTCTSSFAAGTQSANVALTNGDYVKFTFVADGTSKQATWVVTGTY